MSSAGLLLIGILTLIAGAFIAAARLKRKRSHGDGLSLTRRLPLDGDRKLLYRRLRTALPGYHVFPSFHLPTLLAPDNSSANTEVLEHAVDFLICDYELKPIVAVELEDAIHGTPGLEWRASQLRRAGIPVLQLNDVRLPKESDIAEVFSELALLRVIDEEEQKLSSSPDAPPPDIHTQEGTAS